MPSASIAFFLSTLENFEAATDFHSPITAFVSTFVSMPPRSVLLNVSITSKLEKDSVVESVKEIAAQTEPRQDSYEDATVVMEEGKHERADSAVSVPSSPSFNNTKSTPTHTTIAINTTTLTNPWTATQSCAVCEVSTCSDGSPLQRCTRCKAIYYCSRKCQKADWRIHKRACIPSNAPSRSASNAPSPTSHSPRFAGDISRATSLMDMRKAADEDAVMQDA